MEFVEPPFWNYRLSYNTGEGTFTSTGLQFWDKDFKSLILLLFNNSNWVKNQIIIDELNADISLFLYTYLFRTNLSGCLMTSSCYWCSQELVHRWWRAMVIMVLMIGWWRWITGSLTSPPLPSPGTNHLTSVVTKAGRPVRTISWAWFPGNMTLSGSECWFFQRSS